MIGQTVLFNFDIVTSLGEGTLNSNLLNFTLNIASVSHPACVEGLVYSIQKLS